LKSFLRYTVLLIALAGLFNRCSSDRNTWTSKAYHNTTAHYNGYYYSREEIAKIEKTIWDSHKDDYNRVLRLYPALDTALAKTYDKEIQEAIKMASISIQRHPNSKWVDDGYILVGKARLYSLDWGNAITTFKYTNKIAKSPEARHRAILSLIHTFTEHQEYNNAQAAVDFLQKEDLDKSNKKTLLLEKAYLYQMQGNLDYMVRNLSEVAPMLKKRDKPGRVYFIIGQVYQKLGFDAEAYNFYKKCIATNPEYEIDFYARLYMAQVTEISRSKSVNTARKSFRKLLKDSKNKEFKDKIYYEMGIFELKQKNINGAITDLNKSVREGRNRQIDGEAYLRLGEIYYDTLRNYQRSQAYYDSAINALPKDYEGYADIKTRAEILNEFVKHLNTIHWQDSLLAMASLDTAALRHRVDSAVQARKAIEDKKLAKQKKQRNRINIDANENPLFATGDETQNENSGNEEVDWYFGNMSAMAVGQNEFKRVWGDVALEDNWRRSMRADAGNAKKDSMANATAEAARKAQQAEEAERAKAPAVDPVVAELAKLEKQIPRTAEQKKEALAKIEEAYFKLGDIYYFKLHENENAVEAYKKLLQRFPETEYEPEVLYKLWLIYKDISPSESERYATILKQKYPESTYAKILVNPNYLQEASQTADQQKLVYKDAYTLYEQGDYAGASAKIAEANAMGETAFTPNLKLLSILIVGKTENVAQYQYQLDLYAKENPNTDLGKYAQTLLDASREVLKANEKRGGIQYVRSLEEAHYFVMVLKRSDNLSDIAAAALEKLNKESFADLKLQTTNLVLNEQYTLTFVTGLPGVSTAIGYIHTFKEKLPAMTELKNYNFNSFVITKDNFDIFYRTKGLDEYLQFFEKNYPAESQ